MLIIEGFQEASSRLSRQYPADFGTGSPQLEAGIKEVFGAAMTAEEAVSKIIADVRSKGDSALFDYTLRLDRVKLTSLEVDQKQVKAACRAVSAELMAALELAAERIRAFHEAQRETLCRGLGGDEWGQLVRPLARVGVYAPGGTASYPSTVLMTVIPARVAGVAEIILATPPGEDGGVPAATLAAAGIAGASRIFAVGGAQAIAALAYGTESVPPVDKICGPGNIFVTLAKKLVYGAVGIDGLQGPSEVLIIADETARPEYCAADLLAQAEHDPLASSVLVTTSRRLADAVDCEIARQIAELPRRDIAGRSLEAHGVIAVVTSLDEAVELANRYAPEHLELMVKDAASLLDKVQNAGGVFLGAKSPVALGDYVAGPSHVLPTGGTARFGSPLSISDFIKYIDVVSISDENLKKLGKAASVIARAEGLDAHARAVEKRLE